MGRQFDEHLVVRCGPDERPVIPTGVCDHPVDRPCMDGPHQGTIRPPLDDALATAGGNRAVTPRHCRPGHNPLKADTRVIPLPSDLAE